MTRTENQNNENMPINLVRWPSLGFFLGAIKRQCLLGIVLATPVFFLVLFVVSSIPLEYTSKIVVMFDSNEGPIIGSGTETSSVVANRISSFYLSRFTDPEFFKKVAKRLPSDTYMMTAPSDPRKRQFLQMILPVNLQPASWMLTPEEQRDRELVADLQASLKESATPLQYTLTLTGKAADPKDAQSIVRAGMDQFIVDELSRRHDQALARIEALSSLESIMLKEKEPTAELSKAPSSEEPLIPTDSDQKRKMKDKEQILVKEILMKRAEFQRAAANQEGRLLQLQEELNRLLSRRGLTHPEVIQKQREIDKFKAEPIDAPVENQMNQLKSQLLIIQNEMKSRGIPIDRTIQISEFSEDTRRSLAEIINQIRAIENLAQDLRKEIDNPSQSRRLLTVHEPETPTSPSNKKILYMALAVGVLLCGLIFALTIIIREVNQPRLVSAEQMDRLYGVLPTTVVKDRWLKNHPVFDAGQIRELRPQLGQLVSKQRPELRLLDSYRHIAQLVDQMQEHQIIAVFDTTGENHSDSLAANLSKVFSVDSGRRTLFLSFRGRGQEAEESTADLMAFLAGKAEWKDVRFKGSSDGSHDTAIAHDPEESLGAFREDLVLRLFKSLREKYQIIIVEAFPPAFNSENGILHHLADAVVLQIRLGETRHEDLSRLLHFMDRRKIAASFIS